MKRENIRKAAIALDQLESFEEFVNTVTSQGKGVTISAPDGKTSLPIPQEIANLVLMAIRDHYIKKLEELGARELRPGVDHSLIVSQSSTTIGTVSNGSSGVR